MRDIITSKAPRLFFEIIIATLSDKSQEEQGYLCDHKYNQITRQPVDLMSKSYRLRNFMMTFISLLLEFD